VPGEVVHLSGEGLIRRPATPSDAAVAGRPGRAEQHVLGFNPNLEPHWQTFDLRSIAWPDAAVVGFTDAPPIR
jgi:hypothetical protein